MDRCLIRYDTIIRAELRHRLEVKVEGGDPGDLFWVAYVSFLTFYSSGHYLGFFVRFRPLMDAQFRESDQPVEAPPAVGDLWSIGLFLLSFQPKKYGLIIIIHTLMNATSHVHSFIVF